MNENTGEHVGNGGFFQAMEVDKTQFVKLYVDGVSAIEGLSSSGKKVFKILYLAIRDNKDTDTILMSYDIVDQDIVKISRTTYFKGMKELLIRNLSQRLWYRTITLLIQTICLMVIA